MRWVCTCHVHDLAKQITDEDGNKFVPGEIYLPEERSHLYYLRMMSTIMIIWKVTGLPLE